MQKHIQEVIKAIEQEYGVKVLYAAESGSRAWGFPSEDSDFDVRFIYVQRKEWYLSIDQHRDVIEIPKNDLISIPINELLDVSGWELTKALRLFRKSNPPLFEWLYSNIIYYQAFSTIEKMKAMANELVSPVTFIHHYLNMAKTNFRKYFQQSDVLVKKYFYVLRPILACKWIEKYESIPPVEFQILVERLFDSSSEVKEAINSLLNYKMSGKQGNMSKEIDVIREFSQQELNHLELYIKGLSVKIPDPTPKLNQIFLETLEEAWRD